MKTENANLKPEYVKLLQEIKDSIEQSKTYYEGIIEGIVGSRVGFIRVVEEKKSFVLSPYEMDRVLPGDKVKFLIKKENNQDKCELIELLDSPLKTFTGLFTEDETGCYVIPDVYGLNRKIRIPKSYKMKAKKDDFVKVEVFDHPFDHKKPKAKVLDVIGSLTDDLIEINYTCYKNNILDTFPSVLSKEVKIFDQSFIDEKGKHRKDFRSLNFITIDSESTSDIDDAICVDYRDGHWKLYVAIADVSEFVIAGSNLDKEAKARTSSIYFLGKNIPMIPSELSSDLCSLVEKKDRLAIVCEMDFNDNGDLLKYSFSEGIVNSKAKLSYNEVEEYVQGDDFFVKKHGDLSIVIRNLYHLHNLLKKNREINSILQEYGDDFKCILDPHKKIKDIQKMELKTSQKMVEECMVITNIAAANFLTNNYSEGLYRVHDGIKENKIGDVKALLNKHIPEFDASLLFSLEGFKKIMEELSKTEQGLRIKKIILNNMKKSHFNRKQLGHFCMGFEEYTYFTSPIRRYVDIIVHRLIKTSLNKENKEVDFNIEYINKNITNINRSTKEVEDWLKSEYIERQGSRQYSAIVTSIDESSIRVKLLENGIEGVFILTKNIKTSEGFCLNKSEQTVSIQNTEINILQTVEVEYDKFDFINKRIIFKNISVKY